jgi:hypothetical protein
LGLLVGVAALLLVALARPGGAAPPPDEVDRESTKLIEAAQDYITEKAWDLALATLQKVLMYPEDKQVELRVKDAAGRLQTLRLSAHGEAERMILNLPPEGRAAYQEKYGPAAAELLKKALDAKDVAKL